MKDVFISTVNYQKLKEICEALLETSFGLEMAKVVGRAGLGKTTSAERIVTQMPNVAYVCYDDLMSHVGLIREIAFVLGGLRPSRTDQCREIIMDELARQRRVILVDEADKMSSKHFNTLRTVLHDKCRVPIVLIGEESLTEKVSRERRLISRISKKLTFEPLSQPDVLVFFRTAMDTDLSPKQAAKIAKASGGDFRMLINKGLEMEQIRDASGLKAITEEIIDEVCGNGNGSDNGR